MTNTHNKRIIGKHDEMDKDVLGNIYLKSMNQSSILKYLPTVYLWFYVKILNMGHTHPLKKGLDEKINTWLLTPIFIIIYQAEHNLWCPENVGWENFA